MRENKNKLELTVGKEVSVPKSNYDRAFHGGDEWQEKFRPKFGIVLYISKKHWVCLGMIKEECIIYKECFRISELEKHHRRLARKKSLANLTQI